MAAPDPRISTMDEQVALPRKNGELVFEAPWEARAFGLAVALVGNTALVGADGAGSDPFSNEGTAYAFTNSGGTWSETQQLVADDGQSSDSFGESVAFDGNTALIGAPGVNNSRGAAYVFDYSGGIFTQVKKLVASDGGEGDHTRCTAF